VPQKNKLAVATILGREVPVSRTGYTGEPVGFEIFPPSDIVVALYHRLLECGKEAGIVPAGLGARDTLRLEAGLPLYGHELGVDADGREIPIMALPISKVAVSFAEVKGNFIGCEKIRSQFEEVKLRQERAVDAVEAGACVPRMITPVVISGAGIARAGFPVYVGDKPVGSVTSGTAVPYWEFEKVAGSKPGNQSRNRALALTYLDSALEEWQRVSIQVRDRAVEGMVVKRFLSGQAPPYARPVFPEDSLNV
jgi:aminomethyltransferase